MAKNRPRRTLLFCVREAVIIYVLVVAGMYFLQGYMLFHPRGNVYRTPSFYRLEFENVMLDVKGGRTNGWFIPLKDARGTILFSHGNAGNISDWLYSAKFLRSLGFSVLLYDYGGFGNSTGKVSEERCYTDARAMWNWLTETRRIPPEKVIIYGQSLGGGVAADLAKQVHPGAVVLESTFLSIPDAAADRLPLLPARWLCRYKFNTVDKIGDIHAPILIIHSPDDTLVPFAQGKMLFQLANEPKTFLEIHGNHNDGFLKSEDIYSAGWEKFIAPLFPETLPLP